MRGTYFIVCSIVLGIVAVSTGKGSTCYSCKSETSWIDCEKSQVVTDCAKELHCLYSLCDTCVKFYGKQNKWDTGYYHKGCGTKYGCSTIDNTKNCDDLKMSDCASWCCSTDNCNNAPPSRNPILCVITMILVKTFLTYLV